MNSNHLFRRVPAVFAAIVTLSASGLAVAAADVDKEISTAAEHAHYAASSQSIAAVHMHLHHVINCLVGPAGAAFDANQLNPCAKIGNGAIPDSQSSDQKQALEKVVEDAKQGLATNDLKAAQQQAETVHKLLSDDEA